MLTSPRGGLPRFVLNNRPTRKRKIVSSKNRKVIVRSVRRAEPDYDKLAKVVIEHVVEQRRKEDPESVQWYYDRHPWLDRDKSA